MTPQRRDLSVRMRGDDVARLQQRLRELGFDIPDVPGVFGSATKAAVRKFQAAHVLPVTGVVDPRTAASIAKARPAASPASAPSTAPAPPTTPVTNTMAKVHGRVTSVSAIPLGGLMVEAVARSLREERELGRTEIGPDGSYLIDYRTGRRPAVDLLVRVFDPTSPDKAITESPLFADAAADLQVDLRVSDAAYRGPSEYERLQKQLTPLLGDVPVTELSARQVVYLATKAGLDEKRVAWFVRAASLARESKLPAEVLYGLFRQDAPVGMTGLLAVHPKARRALIRAAAEANVISARFGEQKHIDEAERLCRQAAAQSTLKSPAGPEGAAVRELLALAIKDPRQQRAFVTAYVEHRGAKEEFWGAVRSDPRLSKRVDDVQLTLQLGAITGNHLPLVRLLQEKKQRKEFKTARDLARLSASDWRNLVRVTGVPVDFPGTDDQEREALYAGAIARLVEDAYPTAFFAARVAESALPTKAALTKFLAANDGFALNGTRLETYVAEHPNALDAVRENDRAELKKQVKVVQRLYQIAPRTHQVLALQESGIDSAHAITSMGPALFEAKCSKSLGGPARAAEIYQRAEQASATALNILANYGLAGSKFPLGALSDGAATADAGIPDWRTLFGSLELCDCEHCRSVLGPAAYYVDILHFLAERKLVDDLPYTTETLADGTEIEVLDVDNVTLKARTLAGGSTVDLSPKHILFDRRPDLGEVELTCENTNIALPYTDLANEVLEEAVAPLPVFTQFTLASALADTLDARVVSSGLVSAFAARGHTLSEKHAVITVRKKTVSWIIDDLACSYSVRKEQGTIRVVARGRQTSGSAQERAANPQYVNDAAYQKLAGHVFPLSYYDPLAQQVAAVSLPFSLSMEEIRSYLGHLGVQRHVLMEALLPGARSDILADTELAHEYLGLIPEEVDIITGTTTSQPGAAHAGVWNLWGFLGSTIPDPADSTTLISAPAGGWSSTWLARLTGRVDVFLQQSGLKYVELLELLGCYSLNPIVNGDRKIHIKSNDAGNEDTCDPAKLYLEGFDRGTAAKTVRFLRLWRKLGWKMRDLDQVILALGSSAVGAAHIKPAELDDGFLVSLSHIARLHKALKLPVDKLAAWWSADLATEHLRQWWTCTYIDHAASGQPTLPSLYARLFRNKAVTNPIDEAFTEEATNLGGPAGSPVSLADHSATVTAALGIGAADLALLTADRTLFPSTPGRLSLPDLVELYRHAGLAKAVKLSVRDYLSVLRLLCATPFADTASTALFVERVAALRGAGFKVAELDYLLRHSFTSSSGVAPTDEAIALVLDEIRAGLQTVQAENSFVKDPTDKRGLTRDPDGELTKKKLALLNWETALVEDAVAMLNGTAGYEADLAALPNDVVELPNDTGAYEADLAALPAGYSFPAAVKGVVYYDAEALKLKAVRELTDTEEAALRSGLPAAMQTAVDELLDQPAELEGLIEFDTTAHKLRFTGPMTTIRRARLKAASLLPAANATYVAYCAAVDTLFQAPRTFVARNMLVFPVQTYEATLVELPEKVVFPDALSARIYHDADEGLLCFVGAMTQAELETLKALASDPADAALNALYAGPGGALDVLFAAPGALVAEPGEAFLAAADSATLFDDGMAAAKRFEFVLERLLKYLRRTLSQGLVKQVLSDSLKLEAESVDELLLDRVGSAKTVGDTAMADFLDPAFVATNLKVKLTRDKFPALFDTYQRLHKIALVVSRRKITAEQLTWMLDGGESGSWVNLSTLPVVDPPVPPLTTATFETWERLMEVCRLRDELPVGDTLLEDVFALAASSTSTVSDILAALCTETEWDETDAAELATGFGYAAPAAFANGRAVRRLVDAFVVLDRLGMSTTQCEAIASASTKSFAAQREIARGVIQAARAKYDDEEWHGVARPLRNVLRERQRAALVAYLVTHPLAVTQIGGGTAPGWRDVNGLYAYYLIDVEMTPCQLTSRIKQAISSVQLFAQRCLLNLEAEVRAGVEFDTRWREWNWMKSYRVWEANRKVFLYPENWIEPELRDDKSEFFKELESELQQTDLSRTPDDTDIQVSQVNPAETAFEHYLEKLEAVARLEVVGMYHQQEAADLSGSSKIDILHVFGRTRGVPHVYYYRRRVDAKYWTPWEKVNVDIEGDNLVPIVWNRRLYLFWLIFTEKQEETSSLSLPTESDPLESPEKYWEVQLAWSERQGGKWSPKQIGSKKILSWYDDDADDGGKSEHVVRARVTSDDKLCVWWEPPGGRASMVGDPDRPYTRVDAFYLTGCGGLLYVGETYRYGVPELQGTEAAGEFLVEEYASVVNDLYLPDTSAGTTEAPALADTPGVGPFYLLYPHQDYALTGARPFFFQDDTRTFFVTPEWEAKSLGSLVAWADATQLDPWAVGGYLREYFDEPELGVAESRPPIRVVEKSLSRSRDPLLFEPSYEVVAREVVAREAAAVEAAAASGAPLFGVAASVAAPAHAAERSAGPEHYLSGLAAVEAVLQPVGIELVDVYIAWLYEKRYQFHMFYHPYVCEFIRHLKRDGMPGLLQRPVQRQSLRFFNHATLGYSPTSMVLKGTATTDDPTPKYPRQEVDFSYGGAYSIYNWELFFHAPLLIADRLTKNQCFSTALKWFHFIFDPTDSSSYDVPKRYWQTKPFFETSGDDYRKESIANILRALAKRGDAQELAKLTGAERAELEELEAKVAEWRKKPFRPHAIARLRATAYQKTVVMKYLDNLIAWGDQLFRRDTIESINEATQLYVYAAELLGRRPDRYPPRAFPLVQTFDTIEPNLDVFSNALVEIESFVPPSAAATSGSSGFQGRVTLPAMLYFCVPKNDKLLAYWDTVADRLFKVRHCMNIEGVVRELPLFEPPIEPGLLIKAAAAGVDISSALNEITAALPHYRFAVMAQKAGDLCAEVKTLGGALLSALEKRDAETLALLRSSHELAMLKAVKLVKEQQIEEAKESLANLQQAKKLAETRKEYYSSLPFMNAGERTHMSLSESAQELQTAQSVVDLLANVLCLIPDFKVGCPTTIGATLGGSGIGGAVKAMSNYMASMVSMTQSQASLSATKAGYERRWDEWDLQRRLAEKEMEQIDKQILAAKIRQAIAEQELKNHDRQIDNAQEVDEFMHDKFTNQELYDWMVGQVSSLYFQSYQLAYDVAKRTERAYRYELGLEDSNFIQFGYWDSLKKGLLAGERLHHDLKRMEVSYLDQHRRELEITKHVSLVTWDPVALLKLRETGECYFTLPETLYDVDYPGHYMRRIKSAGLTIPCVTGPYAGVSCTLTLLKHSLRKNALLLNDTDYERQDEDTRFIDSSGVTQSIATSNGQNDSGLFELNFHDDRFLPFEGAGAISGWHLQLPRVLRPFDYDTISDVVLHVRYTARDGGAKLRQAAEEGLIEALESALLAESRRGLYRLFSVRQEFPDEWYRFLHPAAADQKQSLSLKLTKRLFPFLLRDKALTITQADLFLALSGEPAEGADTSPAEAYAGGKALSVVVTSPGGTSTTAQLKTDQTFRGVPHGSVKSLSETVGEHDDTWVLETASTDIKKCAGELWEKPGSYEHLLCGAIEDLVMVLRFSIA